MSPDHIVDSNPQVKLAAYEEPPDDACVQWEQCQNRVPENGKMCGDCLDTVRRAESSYSTDDF